MTPDEYAGRCTRFLQAQPHMRKLGVELVHAEASKVTLQLPVRPELVSGALETYLHGGVLTTLVDAASSVSTLCALEAFELCPTLDLRIDHMRIPSETRPVFVDAECYRITRSVLFTRALVYQDDKSNPIANAVATFMRPESGPAETDFRRLIEEGGDAATA